MKTYNVSAKGSDGVEFVNVSATEKEMVHILLMVAQGINSNPNYPKRFVSFSWSESNSEVNNEESTL